jgi:lactate dehydrogenase-like 2-hydroxyacid dehydrogenase
MKQSESTADAKSNPLMDALRSIWRRAKVEKFVRIGPVFFIYRFRRRSVFPSAIIKKHLVSLFRYTSKDNNINLDSVQKFARNVDEPLRIISNPETAVIVGVGPGLGYAVARKLAKVGMSVALVSRNVDRLDSLVNNRIPHEPEC